MVAVSGYNLSRSEREITMTTQVQKDQIWQDNHVNRKDRKFKVEAILGDEALVKSISGTDRPKFTKIKLKRFTPRYYSLVDTQKNQATSATTTQVPVPNPVTQKAIEVPALTGSPVGGSLLLQTCQINAPHVNWIENRPGIVEATHGNFNVVIRNYQTDSYDVKIRMDGVILDTWVANHLDFGTVFGALQDRVREMTESMTKFL
jgi:hypothetical protein